VLAPTGTPDDEAVFVDIRTAWVIAGIGHGHQDVIPKGAAPGDVAAAAAILQYARITPENIDSFHFHGDSDGFPVTAVLVVPQDVRAATILRGRYLDPESALQIVVPGEVVQGLVDRIFRIRSLLDAVILAVGAAALAAVGLAMFLSWQLRAREIATAVRIGARRGMVLRLLAAEAAILLAAAGFLATLCLLPVLGRADAAVAWLLALGA
jgi:putative ABC transport system permease protein